MGKRVKGKGRAGKGRSQPYPYEFRLKLVRLYLEEGYSTTVLREQFGVSSNSVHRWAKAYREQGTEGLVAKLGTGSNRLPAFAYGTNLSIGHATMKPGDLKGV